MFTIIGGDGKEYGPVTADQVRAWITQGRANLETKAKALGSEEWRRLGDYAEFGAAPGFAPPPPAPESAAEPAPAAAEPQPQSFQPAGAVDAKTFADAAIARAAPLDVLGCIERGWELYKANFGGLFLVTLLMMILEVVVSKLFGYVPGPRWEITPKISLGMDTWASLLISPPIYGALNVYYLGKLRGRPVDIGDVLRTLVELLGPLLLVGLVANVLTGVGCMFLILPGLYLAVAYSFAKVLVADHRMPFWTALEVSRRVVTAQWWRVLGLWLLATLVALLGLIGLLVGILFTIPILYASIICAYEDLFNPPAKP
ncbi:MAG: DUF4339 domain-containing protein [Verrucomicrobia bacterium]|nr:DUF4339 domain-containing protein [Verrucomicrobiota bacterium]